MADAVTARLPLNAEALFDDVGPAYEPAFSNEAQDRSVAWVIDKLTDQKPAKILDVGCGTGKPVCSSFSDAGHDVLGIDVSSVMLEHARKAVPNVKFQQVNVLDFQAPKATFDAITVYFSMIADITQEQIRKALREFHEWLKPGGVLVFASVAIDNNLVEGTWLGRPLLGSSFSAEGTLNAVRMAGFAVSHSEEELFFPKAVEVGLCEEGQASSEPWIFVHATKSE